MLCLPRSQKPDQMRHPAFIAHIQSAFTSRYMIVVENEGIRTLIITQSAGSGLCLLDSHLKQS